MFRLSVALIAAMGLFTSALAHEPGPAVHQRPLVQVAVLLDTSNSMDGLIDQARTQLWKIVNEISKCSRDGQPPRVQVALFEYGNNGISTGESYVRMVLPFGENLDDISEKLFALKTNGGEEYCGAVIASAVSGLQWNASPKVYKSIFICGNEPFTQGPTDFRAAVTAAFSRGIIVNTIHCGTRDDGISGQWTAGAEAGRGKFMNINQDCQIVATVTPYDRDIEKLSTELNATYVPFGAKGEAAKVRQSAQDENASANAEAGASVQRALTKSGKAYDNSDWDLVDALKEQKLQLQELPDAALPEPIRGKDLKEKQAYVEAQGARRAQVQKDISALNAQREKFLAENSPSDTAKDTLDAALIESLRDQMKEHAFEVPAE